MGGAVSPESMPLPLCGRRRGLFRRRERRAARAAGRDTLHPPLYPPARCPLPVPGRAADRHRGCRAVDDRARHQPCDHRWPSAGLPKNATVAAAAVLRVPGRNRVDASHPSPVGRLAHGRGLVADPPDSRNAFCTRNVVRPVPHRIRPPTRRLLPGPAALASDSPGSGSVRLDLPGRHGRNLQRRRHPAIVFHLRDAASPRALDQRTAFILFGCTHLLGPGLGTRQDQ